MTGKAAMAITENAVIFFIRPEKYKCSGNAAAICGQTGYIIGAKPGKETVQDRPRIPVSRKLRRRFSAGRFHPVLRNIRPGPEFKMEPAARENIPRHFISPLGASAAQQQRHSRDAAERFKRDFGLIPIRHAAVPGKNRESAN